MIVPPLGMGMVAPYSMMAPVDHVFALFVDRAAEEADKGAVGEDALGDGVDEEAGVDEGFAGAFAFDGAFGERFEGYAAGDLDMGLVQPGRPHHDFC